MPISLATVILLFRIIFSKIFKACNFIRKHVLGQVFPGAVCVVFKNTFFKEHLRVKAYVDFGILYKKFLYKSLPGNRFHESIPRKYFDLLQSFPVLYSCAEAALQRCS